MSGRRAKRNDDQLSFPDWVDVALRASPAAERAPRRPTAPRRPIAARRAEHAPRPARVPRRTAVAEGQVAFDLTSPSRAAGALATPPGLVSRRLFLIATLLLLMFGIVMAYSASTAHAYFTYGSSFYYLKRQVLFAVVGLAAMGALSRIDYVLWRRLAWPLAGGICALIAVVLVPGVGVEVNGAQRWLDVGGSSLQPSEFAKLGAIVLAAALITKRPKEMDRFGHFVFVICMAVVPFALLILLGKDLSTTAVLVVGVGAVLVAAGVRWRYLLSVAALLPVLAAMLVLIEPYRLNRFLAFLDPWADAADGGFQATQSLISVASGHLFGVGLGESVQKTGYLPEATTDMIASIIGEELGLFGLCLLIGLYVLFTWAGLRIALECREPFGRLVAVGVTTGIAVQAVLNIAAALGLLPILGVPLPLVSCGGTSLLAVLASVGVLLNIATNRRSFIVATPERRKRAHSSRGHGRPHGARSGGR